MDKDSLRKSYLLARRSLDQLEIQSKTQLISQRLINYIPWEQLKLVHLYLPIPENNEVDTLPIINHIRANYHHLQIAVPKVESAYQLGHYLISADTQLVKNIWGIPEPVNADPVSEDKIDLVIAPMIIFDTAGHRVGYGKGYYDRFLANCRPDTLKIGLCYFDPVDPIEIEPTDIAMDVVISPEGIWEFDNLSSRG